jgi:hypothetical protein
MPARSRRPFIIPIGNRDQKSVDCGDIAATYMIRVLCLDSPAHPVGDHRPPARGRWHPAVAHGRRQQPLGHTRPIPPEPATAPRIAPAPEPLSACGRSGCSPRRGCSQDGAGTRQQRWLLSPELVSISDAATELDLFELVARQVGLAAYNVGPRSSEWVATLHPPSPSARAPGHLGRHPDRESSELASAPVALSC